MRLTRYDGVDVLPNAAMSRSVIAVTGPSACWRVATVLIQSFANIEPDVARALTLSRVHAPLDDRRQGEARFIVVHPEVLRLLEKQLCGPCRRYEAERPALNCPDPGCDGGPSCLSQEQP